MTSRRRDDASRGAGSGSGASPAQTGKSGAGGDGSCGPAASDPGESSAGDAADEGLLVEVQAVDIESGPECVSCWRYLSHGLRARGQREMMFLLRMPAGAGEKDFPRDPLDFFRAVHAFAGEGKYVEEGEYTEFGASGFLGRRDWRALGYLAAPGQHGTTPGSGADPEPAALLAIALTEPEFAIVKDYGLSRVAARLGREHRYYPCPPWSDPDRPALVFSHENEESLLAELPRLFLRDTHVRLEQEQGQVVLQLALSSSAQLRDQLAQAPPSAPLCLLANIDPEADACLVWSPGQQQPEAYAAPGGDASVLAGCFCALVPQQQQDGGEIIEDGFVFRLTDASWMRVREALVGGEPSQLPAAAPHSLALRLRFSSVSG